MTDGPPVLAPSRERQLLWLLAFTQFTLIFDFVIMMPLGPLIMTAFDIGPTAFATAVSAYAWCAGLSGFFGATYIDRFDRKRLLLVMFAVFGIANLCCALAPNFHVLLLARAFTGISAGVVGSVVLAIVGDVIPAARRGTAMGVVMTAFPVAMVAGVPIGVSMAAHFGWAAPFFLLLVLTGLAWLPALRIVPSLTAHLAKAPAPFSRALPELIHLVSDRRHLTAFGLSFMVMSSGMMIIPFFPTMLVANRGIAPADVAWVYMAGGLATMFTARFIGRMADRHGKARVFRVVATLAALPMLFITHFPPWPLAAAICLFPVFMVLVSGRQVPLQALQTMVPVPAKRGAFLSVNSAVMSVATGCGAWIGGLLVTMSPDGKLVGFESTGWAAAFMTCAAALWVSRVTPAAAPAAAAARPASPPEPAKAG